MPSENRIDQLIKALVVDYNFEVIRKVDKFNRIILMNSTIGNIIHITYDDCHNSALHIDEYTADNGLAQQTNFYRFRDYRITNEDIPYHTNQPMEMLLQDMDATRKERS